MRIVVVLTLWIVGLSPLLSQAPEPASRFEVASVKPLSKDAGPSFPGKVSPGWYVERGIELRFLIMKAFGTGNDAFWLRFGLVGGSPKLLSSRFAITARVPEGASPKAKQAMIRTLLAERFKFRWHAERRPMSVYALTVARPGTVGPMLRSTDVNCAAFRRGGGQLSDAHRPRDAHGHDLCWGTYDFGLEQQNVKAMLGAGDLASIIEYIQPSLDRPLVDMTGLMGSFEWHLTFANNPDKDSSAPVLGTALREQLGLEIRHRTMPLEVMVVDSLEMPRPD